MTFSEMPMPDGSKLPGVETVPLTEFKARMAELVDSVERNGTTIALTQRGKVVAELSRPRLTAPHRRRKSPFGAMKGTIKIHGDIVSPLDVEWNVLKPDAKLDPD